MKEFQVMEDALETYSNGKNTVAYVMAIVFITCFVCGFGCGMYARGLL